jgi:hypothetical protein
VTDVGGEPEAMDAYTREVVPANDAVARAVVDARAAREAVLAAPSDLPVPTVDPTTLLDPVLELLAVLDRIPAAVAWALAQLDGWATAGRAGPPPPVRHATDDEGFDRLVAGHVRDQLTSPARSAGAPFDGGDVVGLGVAGSGAAATASDDAGGPARGSSDGARLGPRSPSGLVRRGAGPVGYALTVHDDLRATAADPLATVGDRTVSVTAAVVVEGGLSATGGSLGAIGGAKVGAGLGVAGGPAGAAVGAAAGAAAGSLLGSRVRSLPAVVQGKRALAAKVDAALGRSREPDRYDELRDRTAGRGETTR